uniref:Uncharacterized protein n=1 Tax=Knipowitschia caucasica TaxID=637954 RepID=A0AAV2LL07_KNICA
MTSVLKTMKSSPAAAAAAAESRPHILTQTLFDRLSGSCASLNIDLRYLKVQERKKEGDADRDEEGEDGVGRGEVQGGCVYVSVRAGGERVSERERQSGASSRRRAESLRAETDSVPAAFTGLQESYCHQL